MTRRAEARGKEASALRKHVQELEPQVRRLEKEIEKHRDKVCSSCSCTRRTREEAATTSPTRTTTDKSNAALRNRVEAAEERAMILQLRCDQLERDCKLASTGLHTSTDDGSGRFDRGPNDCERKEIASSQDSTDVKRIKKELEVAERRVKNSLYVSEAHENLAVHATARERVAKDRAAEFERRLQRVVEKLECDKRRDMISRLRASCEKNKEAIYLAERELRIKEIDPDLYLPVNTAKRRQLQKLKQRLHQLRLRDGSQSAALAQAEKIEQGHADLKTAVCCGDIEATRELLRRGIAVNVPDETGLSPFLYACGQGKEDLVEVLLDAGGDVLDGDGTTTGLIIAACKVSQLYSLPTVSGTSRSRRMCILFAAQADR